MTTPPHCIAHPYRPSSAPCKKCGKGICAECQKLYTSLCPQCSGVYVVNKNAVRGVTVLKGSKGRGTKEGRGLGFSLSSIPWGARGALAALLLLSLGILLGLGFFGRGPFPFRRRPAAEEEVRRASLVNLNLAVTCITAYRSRTGALPAKLDDVGLGFDPTLSYQVVSPSRYLLTSTRGTLAITYDSKQDAERFFAGTPSVMNPILQEKRD